ncbi:MAG: hypothetical protein EZS28_006682 [Streblomastix strix]|uniref:Uncharacterized protein n=1 Tax=Streblomastix strix TaxID=222440 RepID=A0A5J4WUF4_9EUKA|nr:MAG: hypothetical protein EZS28_006682 [Streblomastix strix]
MNLSYSFQMDIRVEVMMSNIACVKSTTQAGEYMLEHRELYEEGFAEEEDIELFISSKRNDRYLGDGKLFVVICAKFGVRFRVRIVELGYIVHLHYVSIRCE